MFLFFPSEWQTLSRRIPGSIHIHYIPNFTWNCQRHSSRTDKSNTGNSKPKIIWMCEFHINQWDVLFLFLLLYRCLNMTVKGFFTINYPLTCFTNVVIFLIPLVYSCLTWMGYVSPSFWTNSIVQINAWLCDTTIYMYIYIFKFFSNSLELRARILGQVTRKLP